MATAVMSDAGVDFVTIMDADGIRVTHRDPAQIGKRYIGTIPNTPTALTEEFSGTLGPSLRTIVPVEAGGRLVGWVSVGVTIRTVTAQVVPRLLVVAAVGLVLVGAGLAGAVLARRATRWSPATSPPAPSATPWHPPSRCARSARPCAHRRTSTAIACTLPSHSSNWDARMMRSAS
jgi:hypothetical protein